MRELNFLSLATIATILFVSTLAKANTTSEEFVEKASMGNLFEIESSKLANERTSNVTVKQFADRMIADHIQLSADLKNTLKSANLNSSLIAESLDKKHNNLLTKLKNASEKDFDEDYIDCQEDAHEDTIKLFKDYIKKGANADLKSFAGKNLPTLEDHHKDLEEIESSM